MSDELIGFAERLVHARPADPDEALAALEWIAGREGKTVAQLIAEIGDRVTAGGPGER
jgi:microcystin degradation protein MlrC